MKVMHWRHKVGNWTFTVKEWACHGYTWQLLLSRRGILNGISSNLSVHFCGSNVMRKLIVESTRRNITNQIKELLGLD